MQTKDERQAYQRLWRIRNPDKVKAMNKRKYHSDKLLRPDRLEKKKAKRKEWFQKNKESHRDYQRNWSKIKLGELKERIFDKLGHCCSKCGFSDKRALCIDHVNGGGFNELRSSTVYRYYEKVINDDVGAYQILCHNCNWIKRHENNEVRRPKN